MKRKINFRLII